MFRMTAGYEAGRLRVRRSHGCGGNPIFGVALLLSTLSLAGCSQPPDPRRTNFQVAKDNVTANYDPKTGRLRRIEVDQDRNGTYETVSIWDGNQLKVIEIDTNDDKLVDRWEHYENVPPVMTKIGTSSQRDASEDVWTYLAADGKSIKTVERDTNRDGRADKWEEFGPPLPPNGGPVLRRVGYDQAGTGKATLWLYYGPNGQFERTEAVR